ncbi:transcriptional regulator with XRE-family HTH domain [Deinobacterium chartae]|uniref:Transcriptional regulator with XRE-family HTH domain n=1 Tax=Deinobacterium chartae TaxID=521158 RepID=A0A841HW60_9DEIO|nr:helix-turn-helix transcriptional regulator [Deinobacterium chartae]MBB6097627.1 transcriptional regulator with XRE-family HTH domain [Deinobacterium chartae]
MLPAIGSQLRDLRTAKRLSLRQLARAVHSSPAHLCMIENGQVRPSLDLLTRLAHAFGLSLEALLAYLSEDEGTRASLEALAARIGDRSPRLLDPAWRALLLYARRTAGSEVSEGGWLRLHAALEEVMEVERVAGD